jgi:Tfp pilus assembly protein PilO
MPDIATDRYRRYRRYFTGVGSLYKKRQVRVYTGIVLSILTIAFFSFFAIRPTIVTISGLLKEIKDKKDIVDQMDEKIESLTKAQMNYSQLEDELYLIDESLPLDPDLALLIKQIEALARLSGVNFEGVQFNKIDLQGGKEREEKQEVTFNLTFSGDYQNLKQFLNSLDTLRRTVLVDGFYFKTKMEEETQLLMLGITAKAYYLTSNK